MICKHCQAYIPEDGVFCSQCGAKVETDLKRVWLFIGAVSVFALVVLKFAVYWPLICELLFGLNSDSMPQSVVRPPQALPSCP